MCQSQRGDPTLNNSSMAALRQLLLEQGQIIQSYLQSRDATRGWASWRPVVRGNIGFCYASAFCLARASLWAFKPLGTTAPCVLCAPHSQRAFSGISNPILHGWSDLGPRRLNLLPPLYWLSPCIGLGCFLAI